MSKYCRKYMVSTNVNPSYPRNQLHRLLFDEYASKIPPILLKSHIAEPVAIPISPLDGMMRFLERTLTDAASNAEELQNEDDLPPTGFIGWHYLSALSITYGWNGVKRGLPFHSPKTYLKAWIPSLVFKNSDFITDPQQPEIYSLVMKHCFINHDNSAEIFDDPTVLSVLNGAKCWFCFTAGHNRRASKELDALFEQFHFCEALPREVCKQTDTSLDLDERLMSRVGKSGENGKAARKDGDKRTENTHDLKEEKDHGTMQENGQGKEMREANGEKIPNDNGMPYEVLNNLR
ncbi:MAG: hypothetical protein MMC33_010462 [Icmadophila ericetorum]|nr:hypothetical protein [Icmadophila ericetorum]